MKNYSRTISKLHFEDIPPPRFEALCRDLLFREYKWSTINFPGQLGNDDGVDIDGVIVENDTKIKIAVQCKRHQKISFYDVNEVINTILKNEEKYEVILLIISCEITKQIREKAEKICKENKIELRIWPASYIEGKLFHDYKELLNLYFGIDLLKNKKTQRSLKQVLSIKKRLGNIFRYYNDDNYDETKIYRKEQVVLISENDATYPEYEENESEFTTAHYYATYNNGIEFTLCSIAGVNILMDEKGLWEPRWYSQLNTKKENLPAGINLLPGDLIGRINYKNIQNIDIEKDHYFDAAKLYCDFGTNGFPIYESQQYAFLTKNSLMSKYIPDEYILNLLEDDKKTKFDIP